MYTNYSMIMIMIIITIICDNKKGTCMLIDVASSGDENVIKNGALKFLKHEDITIELECMWNLETHVIPSIIWATRTV